jgi:hypothetical protein
VVVMALLEHQVLQAQAVLVAQVEQRVQAERQEHLEHRVQAVSMVHQLIYSYTKLMQILLQVRLQVGIFFGIMQHR